MIMSTKPAVVGVLGAGQLGRMMALAGYELGLRFRFLDPTPDSPAGQVAKQVVAAFDDTTALADFAEEVDCVTYEFENVPVKAAEFLAQRKPTWPPPVALQTAQDRLAEKTMFRRLGIGTPRFAAVDSLDGLRAACSPESVGLPALLKTRRLGYDGKGQALVRAMAEVEAAWASVSGVPCVLEELVRFEREMSVLAARGRDGTLAVYPLVENHHREGILRLSLAPAPGIDEALQHEAEGYVRAIVEDLDYVGVLTLELFQVAPSSRNPGARRLLANEIAPRTHNSGHWTIEGAQTNQFENHLRAILGLPLGAAHAIGCSAMVNLIGIVPDAAAVLALPGAHLHLYGKQARAGRKLGHVTLRGPDWSSVRRLLPRVQALADGMA